MFQNYWKIALRQLKKQGFYSAIKIGGFALGIATCLLTALYLRHELSYDQSYANGDRLYRIIENFVMDNGSTGKGPSMSAPMADMVKTNFPQVEAAGRMLSSPLFTGAGSNEVRLQGGTQDIYEEGFAFADQHILDLFKPHMVYGDLTHALTEPGSIVITRRKAEKYYPHQDPVGKVLYLNDDMEHPHKIGGVIEDPDNTSLYYDFYLSLAGHELWKGEQQNWLAQNYDTYLLLRPGTDAQRLAVEMTRVYKKTVFDQFAGFEKDPNDLLKRITFSLQPVTRMHLYSNDIRDDFHHGDIRFVWLFGAIGVFILLLACVNFVNLATARGAGRAKEVGLRKVVGSKRSGLVQQFLLESLVLSYFSFLLALGLAWVLLPWFNKMTDNTLRMPWTEWWLLPVLLLAGTVVGVLAGLYPAIYLSRFRPVEVLKGQLSAGSRRSGLRSVLVIFQFTTSMILIVATIVVYRQMDLIMHKDLGFDKDQVMLIQGTGNMNDKKLAALKQELLGLQGVAKVSISDMLPVSGGKRNNNQFFKAGREKTDPPVGAQSWWVDPDYLATFGIKLVEGRNFSTQMASDSSAIVINQAMAKKLGWANPLGKELSWGGDFKMHIVGVVADFNYESIKDEVYPLVLHIGNWATMAAVKVNTADIAALIPKIGGVWKQFAPQQELRYTWLDEQFARMYADILRTQRLFTSLAVLAIVIACLGLFALSAFMAERRRKEIGIRKVLGATVGQLTGLLSGEFLRLVLIAVVIASPVAWWGMHRWLEDYLVRIQIGVWMFVVAGVMVLVIALATICFQAVRAALANPAGSLRAE